MSNIQTEKNTPKERNGISGMKHTTSLQDKLLLGIKCSVSSSSAAKEIFVMNRYTHKLSNW